jgi:hypothetical protein
LTDAISCYQAYLLSRKAHEQALFADAEQWIFFDEGVEFTSFRSICDAVAMDPTYVRRGLLAWKQRRLAGARPAHAKPRWRSAARGQRSLPMAALRK